ncbi:F-box/LRR-repeat protein [Striga hermonthica]|uniref:F-box/LRR-repeat protein n=1 Tax=Striga hermonthica TaxID=68872 RepID=A0A9N7NVI9_STRHE|nr:F-box/LRR-repeat protein [Striga hermonthica]
MEADRISQLPIPILHNIVCFISQKEAVRTCLLSKKWRHIGLTRPNLEFFEEWFDDTEEKFISVKCSIGSTLPNLNSSSEKLVNITQEKFVPVVDRTLQRCNDQNRSILHRILSFLLCRSWRHKGSGRLSLDSSEILFNTTHQNTVSVNSFPTGSTRPNLESTEILFNSTPQDFVSVVNRTLQGYLDQNLSIHKLHLDLSRAVSRPVISLLDKWIPIIATLDIKVFELNFLSYTPAYYDLPSAVFLAESLEELHLYKCRLSPIESVRFKSLRKLTLKQVQVDGGTFNTKMLGCPLLSVILSSESFDLFSFGCPTLAILTLDNCSGFEEFHLASDSVNWLRIATSETPLKGVTICAPNILKFTFTARIPQVPDTFSFTTTTSMKWFSQVFFSSCEDDPDFDANSWFLELRRLLKALSGSDISLYLEMGGGPQDVSCSAVLGDELPVVVWSLKFYTCKCRTASWYLEFANALFLVCRPSRVWGDRLVSESDRKYYRLSEFQLNILLAYKNVDLEEVHVDGQLVQWTDMLELRNKTYDEQIWLELKWRGQTGKYGFC